MVRCQHEEVGPGEQPEHVRALAEEPEPLPEAEGPVLASSSSRSGPRPTGREATGAPASATRRGGAQQDVVALLGAEVGDGEHEHVALADAELLARGAAKGRPVSQGLRRHARGRHRGRRRRRAGSARGSAERARRVRRPRAAPRSRAMVARLSTFSGSAVLSHRLCSVYTTSGRRDRGRRRHHQPAHGGGVRKMEVDDVEPRVDEQPAQGGHPSQVGVAIGPEAVRPGPRCLHRRHRGRPRRAGRRPPRSRTSPGPGWRPRRRGDARPLRSPDT